jgi:hypothetical protein
VPQEAVEGFPQKLHKPGVGEGLHGDQEKIEAQGGQGHVHRPGGLPIPVGDEYDHSGDKEKEGQGQVEESPQADPRFIIETVGLDEPQDRGQDQQARGQIDDEPVQMGG